MVNPRKGIGRQSGVIQTELLELFPYFIKASTKNSDSLSKVRTRDFSVITIMKLLSAVSHCSMTYSELHRASNICMKRSYMNYLDMCKHFELVEFTKTPSSTVFKITEKGRVLLELFRI